MKMNLIFFSRCVTTLLLYLGVGFLPLAAFAQTKSLVILTLEESEDTDQMRAGIREVLRAAGLQEGRQYKVQSADAQGSPETASKQALELIRGKPDVILALSQPSAQAAAAHTTTMPIVFVGVTDPVEAGLVPSWGPSGTNITGISDVLPLSRRVTLIRQIVPAAKRVGVIYNATDASSLAQVREFQTLLGEAGLVMVEATATRPIDVASAARSMVGKVDLIYTLQDATVLKAYAQLVVTANQTRLPLLASDVAHVRQGAVAAMDITGRDLGLAAGRITLRVLRGVKPGTIPIEVMQKPPVYLNAQAAQRQGVVLSDALLKSASQVLK
jgi:putative ABC transport system substrate-binding protein